MHSPSFHLPQFRERGETDPCPRPRASVIDLFSAKRERSQPRHATATGMVKLPVRARANATTLGERRMRHCGASARCHRADATQQRRFTLNWRWDGMMCFALLVSRAFCHCSRRGGAGQGRCPGNCPTGAADSPSVRSLSGATGPTSPGNPLSLGCLAERPAAKQRRGATGAGYRRGPVSAPGPNLLQFRGRVPRNLWQARLRGCLPSPRAPRLRRGNRLLGAALPCRRA